MIISPEVMVEHDYGFCKDCNMFFDLWKYTGIEDAGHAGCQWRYVSKKELEYCIKSCKGHGCFTDIGDLY